ncbi:sugar ABC transporter permease [Eubacteriales bacterium OttesenSCG-928-A19]|nr:sugar ABC transporter permease [Eubacteriales bacterium OttesenSCG-928-A19]
METRRRDIRRTVDRMTPVIMLAPALIGVLLVQIYPSLESIRLSFLDKYLLKPTVDFVGLANYREALSDPGLYRVIGNTLLFAVLSLFFASIFAMLVANELNKKFRGRALFRSLFLAPWVTPPLVTSTIWQILLSETFSPISKFLMQLGLISRPINFLGSTQTYLGVFSLPLLSIVMVNVWSIFPFLMVMFLAGLQTIPEELIEASKVDGANAVQRFFRITLPSLMPVIETSLLLQGIWQFNSFNLSYLVTKGGPLNMTMVMAVSVYTEAFIKFRYSYGAAISVLMMLIVLVPALLYLRRTLGDSRNI